MNLELFYPKELKEIIRTLEAEGNLHERPLEVYGSLVFLGFLGFLLSVFVGLTSQNAYIIFVFVALSCLGFMYYLKYCFGILKAYVYGDKQSGKIVEMYTSSFFRGTRPRGMYSRPDYNFVCETETNKKRVILRRIPQDIIDHYKLSIGSTVMFWQSTEHRTIAVPDFEEIKIDYCLRKNLINKDT